jgi:hypothetical protein
VSKFPELLLLSEKFPSLAINSYGGMCPLQCEGVYLGMSFYFRLRHGIASLSLGGADVIGKPKYYEELLLSAEHEGDGYVEVSEFKKIFIILLESLKSKNKF